jgi:hypothetical protein
MFIKKIFSSVLHFHAHLPSNFQKSADMREKIAKVHMGIKKRRIVYLFPSNLFAYNVFGFHFFKTLLTELKVCLLITFLCPFFET